MISRESERRIRESKDAGKLARIAVDKKRWYALRPHPVQQAYFGSIASGIRFPVVPCGRRSGKSELTKRIVAIEALKNSNRNYYIGAPTYAQVKSIYWEDMKRLTISSSHIIQPKTSELTIFLPNGSTITLLGLDKPERIEGRRISGLVCDETADLSGDAIKLNIMPALQTVDPQEPDYRAWCIFCGTPDGLNHFYDLYQDAQAGKPGFALYRWTSEEILPEDVLEVLRANLSEKQYRQEVLASFETASGRIYEDFDRKNITDMVDDGRSTLHWAHDFNYNPMCSSVMILKDGVTYVVDEVVLESADSTQSALEFCHKYRDRPVKKVAIYGDASGRAGQKHGLKSNYTEICRILRENMWVYEMRVKPANPAIRDRQNALRALTRSGKGTVRFFVNPACKWSLKGMETVQLKKGSSFQEDETNRYQHITTALGYYADYLFPVDSNKIKQLSGGHSF